LILRALDFPLCNLVSIVVATIAIDFFGWCLACILDDFFHATRLMSFTRSLLLSLIQMTLSSPVFQ
jgi:hypothetical protein